MRKIRLGVIGTGLAWERLHWPALRRLQDMYEVVAVCDVDKSRAEQAARSLNLGTQQIYTDYREMLHRDDLDAIDILVPIHENYTIAEDVARRGIDFICEKPLGANMEEAKRHVELPKKYGIKILIAENYRYNEENNLIRDLIRNNRLGSVVYFVWNKTSCFPCQMAQDTFASREWRQHPQYPGGAFLDAAIHDLAAMRYIFGSVKQVQAFGQKQKADFSPYRSYHVNIEFFSGVIGQFAYWPSGKDAQRPLLGARIFGTEGVIYLEERNCGIVNLFHADGTSEQFPYTPEQGYYNEFVNFHKALTEDESISVSPEIEYGDVKMVFAILTSLRENRIVPVDKISPHQDKEIATPLSLYH